jgi:galactokinase
MSLQDIYGDRAEAQERRYQAAIERFSTLYGDGEMLAFRAPGRVNLIGEHTDYNRGFVMPVALDKDIVLLARPRPGARVRLHNMEARFPPFTYTIGKEIPPDPPGSWSNYLKGSAQELARRLEGSLQGMDALVASQPPHGVPRGVGLSSSSALTVVAAVALAHLNGWQPESQIMAQLCADAEWYVGTRGGIMDQFIALLGQRGSALLLDCRPDSQGRFQTEPIPLPAGYSILIADSGVRHENVRGGYNRRVAACRAGVELMRPHFAGITHLRDVQDVAWSDLAPLLPEQTSVAELAKRGIELGNLPGLGPGTRLKIRARCRHVWTENARVQAAAAALRAGNVGAFGQLLDAAHASARDDYEISCPELEALVQTAREVDGTVGARLTGAGWGGCIVAVVRNDAVARFRDYVKDHYQVRTGRTASIFACRSAPGAGPILMS